MKMTFENIVGAGIIVIATACLINVFMVFSIYNKTQELKHLINDEPRTECKTVQERTWFGINSKETTECSANET